MKAKLIADAGSTKVEWTFISDDVPNRIQFLTTGINPLTESTSDVYNAFANAYEHLGHNRLVEEIFFYGAGCATESICKSICNMLQQLFPNAIVSVNSDMLGAARALFGKNSGIACILGTGSNSSFYDGESIAYNVPSLGYILGDDGGGSVIGKRFVSDLFKGILPSHLADKFYKTHSLTLADALDRVYRQPSANSFLGSFVPFVYENISDPYMQRLVRSEFENFITRNVDMYANAYKYPLGFIGSIAFNFEDILRDVVDSHGYKIDKIIRAPMEGLINYHTDE